MEHGPQSNQADKIRAENNGGRWQLDASSHTEVARHKTDTHILVPLEVLDSSFVFLCLRLCSECAEISSFPGFRIFLAGIQSVLAGFQFSNHEDFPAARG